MLDKFGLKVSTLYISQAKAKCGIIERENYNEGKEGHRVPKCPKEKEDASLLLSQSKLYQRCAEVEKQARNMFDTLVEQMKKRSQH